MAIIKEREIITSQPYCSFCHEDINEKLLKLKDDDGEYQACPHCKEIIENVLLSQYTE